MDSLTKNVVRAAGAVFVVSLIVVILAKMGIVTRDAFIAVVALRIEVWLGIVLFIAGLISFMLSQVAHLSDRNSRH